MKRTILFVIILLLAAALIGCAAPREETRESLVIGAPKEQDVRLTLPLFRRVDVTKILAGYTDGFADRSGKLVTYSTESEDPDVARASLFEDGTLCILAVREGKTVVKVTGVTETGESAVGRINVTVGSARRTAALIAVGVLAVVLFILFGQPGKKNAPKEEPNAAEASAEEPVETSVEEPVETSVEEPVETSTTEEYVILPERSQKE